MTGNQKLAVALADGVIQNRLRGTDLTDAQWHLLLLAAGLNNTALAPLTVAGQVRQQYAQRAGYFADVHRAGGRAGARRSISTEPAKVSVGLCED